MITPAQVQNYKGSEAEYQRRRTIERPPCSLDLLSKVMALRFRNSIILTFRFLIFETLETLEHGFFNK